MTVFKTALKILNKCKAPIIMYTVFLIAFGSLSFQSTDNTTSFSATKPSILIINNDEKVGITESLITYLESVSEVKKIRNDADAISDALFYRDISYIVYIPKNFRKDFLAGLKPEIEVKSTNDYESSFAQMKLTRYLEVANLYLKQFNEEELIEKINNTFKIEATINITSQVDTNKLARATSYYNFANYSILAGSVYVICLILASFKESKVNKRTIISSMDINKYNRLLLISNGLFSFLLWLIYVILSFVLVGNIMFSAHGLLYIFNSLIFAFCALTIAFLIGNIVTNKEIINGIVNVISLGSSFLCGAFVPMQFLPVSVFKLSKILPSHWYIQTNELIKKAETINMEVLKPMFINSLIIVLFAILFIIITNIITRKKRKIG